MNQEPPAPATQESVYLIGPPTGPVVKIGRTIHLQTRLAEIQRMSPVPLDLRWHCYGGAALETALHRRFADLRTHGEWFDFGDQDPVETVRQTVQSAEWRELAPLVPVPTASKRRRSAGGEPLGPARVELFNRVRKWAYRARRGYDDRAAWEEAVHLHALTVNAELATPLPDHEVGSAASSIAWWVWTRFSEEAFRAIQSARGRQGGRCGEGGISEAKREANRIRATKVDRAALLKAALS